jgi:hypothetical protein
VLAVSLLFLYAFELARFLLGHELAAFLVPLCKDLSIVLVASCERVFLTSATPSGLFVAMCAPLLLLFWLALANDLEAHAGGAQAGSSQVIGLG